MHEASKTLRTWIEIDTSAIGNNVRLFRNLLSPKTKLMGVVKSNAYGHELMGFGRELQKNGVDFLGVDSIVEGKALRESGVTVPILVLGYTLPENFLAASRHEVSVAISSFENLKALKKNKRKLRVHIKVDTGMHRQGFFVSDVPTVLKRCSTLRVAVDGVFTHFAAAKRQGKDTATNQQILQFCEVVRFTKKKYPLALAHAAATAGTLNFPESHFDMVRIGIGLYGLWPSEETREAHGKTMGLKPVLTWKTLISELKWLEKGEKIGYDYTEALAQKSRIAVLPIGYWHGYARSLSSRGVALVSGHRAKVLGRVSMDMAAIDVTGAKNAKVGDEVVLIGKQKNDEITADELSALAGTTSYEIITRLNPLIKKFYM